MKVSKAQAEANRAQIVETASALFREHGYDGVGIADLMAAAGFTHGGFYKQFRSKADLMVESATCGIARTAAETEGLAPEKFVRHYLSRAHRDGRASGCTMAALGGDAARQPEALRCIYADGVEKLLAALSGKDAPVGDERAELLAMLAQAVGAIVMSRACPDDSPLADEILAVCRDRLLRAQGAAGA